MQSRPSRGEDGSDRQGLPLWLVQVQPATTLSCLIGQLRSSVLRTSLAISMRHNRFPRGKIRMPWPWGPDNMIPLAPGLAAAARAWKFDQSTKIERGGHVAHCLAFQILDRVASALKPLLLVTCRRTRIGECYRTLSMTGAPSNPSQLVFLCPGIWKIIFVVAHLASPLGGLWRRCHVRNSHLTLFHPPKKRGQQTQLSQKAPGPGPR